MYIDLARLDEAPIWVNDILRALSDARSRQVLRAISKRAPCGMNALVTSVGAVSGDSVSDDHLRARLHHTDLPTFGTIGLLEYDGTRVTQGNHPGWEASLLDTILAHETSRVDGIIRSVANPATRAVLAVLESETAEIDIETLDDVIAAVTIAGLHHHHLPRIQQTGILEYNSLSGTVQYCGDPLVGDLLDGIAAIPREG